MTWRGNKNNKEKEQDLLPFWLWCFFINFLWKVFSSKSEHQGQSESLFIKFVNGREGCQWGQNNLRPKRSFITTTFIRHHLSNRSGVVIDWSWVLMFTRKNIIIVRWLIKKIYNRMLVEVNGYWVFSTTYLMVFFQTHVRTSMMMNYELMTVVVLVLSKR